MEFPMKKKSTPFLDKIVIGIIIGMIVPLIAFFLYFLIRHDNVEFSRYLGMLHKYGLLFRVLSLCVLFDLPVFYGFIHFKYWRGARGMVVSCFFYGFAVAIYSLIH
jgi:hypothetical protein